MEKSSCYPKQSEWIFWSGIRGWKRRHKGRYITTSMWCIFCIIYPKLNVSICVYMNKYVIYLHATISIFRWSDTCPSLSVSILYAPHPKKRHIGYIRIKGLLVFKTKTSCLRMADLIHHLDGKKEFMVKMLRGAIRKIQKRYPHGLKNIL